MADTSLTTGGPCNGAGVVVNSTVDDQSYCRCYPMYSGGSDFFDTRFIVPSDPTLSLTCSNARIGEIVVWSLVLLGTILRIVQVAQMTREKYKQFHERTQKRTVTWKNYYDNFALRMLGFDLLVLTPICLACATLKVAGQVMGTDSAVTVLYIMVVIAFQKGNLSLASEEFKTVTHFVPKDERVRLVNLRFQLDVVSWVSYLVGAIFPTVAALFLDKSLGPLRNFEFVTILVRNLFVVCWSSFALWSNYIVFSKFEGMIGSIINSASAEAVTHMRDANKKLIRLYFIISLLYAIFTIPQLWAFQTYCYGLIVFFGTFRHPAKAFKSMKTFSGAGNSGMDGALKVNDISVNPSVTDGGSLVTPFSRGADPDDS